MKFILLIITTCLILGCSVTAKDKSRKIASEKLDISSLQADLDKILRDYNLSVKANFAVVDYHRTNPELTHMQEFVKGFLETASKEDYQRLNCEVAPEIAIVKRKWAPLGEARYIRLRSNISWYSYSKYDRELEPPIVALSNARVVYNSYNKVMAQLKEYCDFTVENKEVFNYFSKKGISIYRNRGYNPNLTNTFSFISQLYKELKKMDDQINSDKVIDKLILVHTEASLNGADLEEVKDEGVIEVGHRSYRELAQLLVEGYLSGK